MVRSAQTGLHSGNALLRCAVRLETSSALQVLPALGQMAQRVRKFTEWASSALRVAAWFTGCDVAPLLANETDNALACSLGSAKPLLRVLGGLRRLDRAARECFEVARWGKPRSEWFAVSLEDVELVD